MGDPLASLVDVIASLIDALEVSGLPCALGGAVAYSDLRDLERLLAVQGARFDRPFVRRWLVDMLGEGSEQVAVWDRLAR